MPPLPCSLPLLPEALPKCLSYIRLWAGYRGHSWGQDTIPTHRSPQASGEGGRTNHFEAEAPVRQSWVCMLTPLLTGCVTLGKLLHFSEPQHHLFSGGGQASLRGLVHKLSEITWAKPLACVSGVPHLRTTAGLAPGFLASYEALERWNHASFSTEYPKQRWPDPVRDHLPIH